ncbi:ATP phosphoribosyltransferase regulatory subunit [Candidatus Curtissbacteria bacterium]|nr:ATP phosphoribosyltransferase regulatory subunit [Candidatus Curtissbacteria bacterium]
MQKAPPTPKGFRDIHPELSAKRRRVINKIIEVLEDFGFVPLETPTIEFAETLKGKYGEEERLIYEFTDRGGRRLALRYDLTVPLARYVASNPSLEMPFRRWQAGQVFRGENPQHGRYREFTQLDFDTVGSSDFAEDAKIIAAAHPLILPRTPKSLQLHSSLQRQLAFRIP